MAATRSSDPRIIGPAAMMIVVSLGACANNGQLLAPGASGTIQVYSGDKLMQWPAQFVSWDHPANAEAMPFSKRLWDVGYKIPEAHCYLIDGSGDPTRLSLLGVWNAAEQGQAVGKIGDLVPPGTLAAARKDFNRIMQVYTEAVWKASGGAQPRIEAILRDAVNHDATCLRMERIWIQRRLQLIKESKAPVRDLDGRPGIATINREDPNLRGHIRQGIQLLEEHDTLVRNVISSYGFVAQALTSRVAAVRVPVASAPAQPGPPPSPSKPAAPAAPSRQEETRFAPVPVSVPPTRIVVDTTLLQRESDETQAALVKVRQLCLSKAAIDCS